MTFPEIISIIVCFTLILSCISVILMVQSSE